MKSFNNEQKNNLLKEYYVDNKTFLIVTIISSSLILLTAILIIILLTTSTNTLYEDEEILRGYILVNSITAKYRIEDTNKPVLLYNNKYTNMIHTIRINGEKINEVKNEYTFPTTGEYEVKLSIKKPLKRTDEFFINCERLIEVNLVNLTSEKIKNSSRMFYNCSNLEIIDFTSYRYIFIVL